MFKQVRKPQRFLDDIDQAASREGQAVRNLRSLRPDHRAEAMFAREKRVKENKAA